MLSLFDDAADRTGGKVAGIYADLVTANIAVWVWALGEFGDRPLLLGMAFLAYSFGLRHAVDADHIAAIDNVVRKLMQEEKRPLSVGFFFSLGHSTVVTLGTIAVAATAATLQSWFAAFKTVGGLLGVSFRRFSFS